MRTLAVISLTFLGCSETRSMPLPACTADTCQRALSFTSGPDLPAAMDHHGTVIATTDQGAFLYVLGGNDYRRQFRTVWVAALSEDGSVGSWVAARPLPEARAGHGVAVVKGRIVVVSGQAQGLLDTVYSAAVQPDGTLGDWEPEPSLPEARFHSYVAATPEWLYVTGGVDANFDATDSIFRAAIGAGGRLGAFTALAPMPTPRSHHTAAVHDGFLYLAGGLTGNPTTGSQNLADIWSAPIQPDGTLGAFSTAATLDDPAATLAQFELDGDWCLVGGLDDRGRYLSTILKLPFLGGGKLGAASEVMPGLPVGRSHVHQTPLYHDHFYSIGGSIRYQTLTNAVQVGAFDWEPATGVLN